jgi:ribosomal protein S18 acetylase RimI-like enzyme
VSLRFRPATEADWPQLWPILQEIVVAGETYVYDPAMDSAAGLRTWLPGPPEQTWLVSGEQGTVLGSYKTGPNRPGPGGHVATASYIVDRAARGHGVGRAMVLHSLDQARAGGFRGIQFNAVAASNGYAVKLYQELGFDIVGAVPGGFRHPRLGFVDLLIMYRDLTRD